MQKEKDRAAGCPFCGDGLRERIIDEEGSVAAVADKHPVTSGHTLIIPRRHVEDCFGFTPRETEDAGRLLRRLKERIQAEDPLVTGFNIGINCGVSAGQTIPHAHIHLIPRRDGDTPRPRGGVRGVIPEKMSY